MKQVLERPGAVNITKLNLSKNCRLSDKAGIFLGDALKANCHHPVEKLSFKKINLGEDGLVRILEATNVNQNIVKLNLGLITDYELNIIAKCLKHNKSLDKLKFEEHPDSPWCQKSKDAFVCMIQGHKCLTKVKFDEAKDSDHKTFKKEIEFYVKKIKKEHKAKDAIEKRKESCTNDHLFNDLLEMIENKEDHEKMPVRKFFNNTFGSLLNDAIFALMKKQSKSKSTSIRTM